jgi:plastocyanin
MESEKTDQQQFDEDVNRIGKRILEIAAGVGIFAALTMSLIALLVSTNNSNGTTGARMPMMATPSKPAGPQTASIMIDHVTRGCHTLDVNGSRRLSPRATIRLAAGGTLRVQNNDVMPHTLVFAHGPQAALVAANMNHMGAKSTVTFAKAGTYTLTTKAGEDYMKGVKTIGPDNTLRIKVVVA